MIFIDIGCEGLADTTEHVSAGGSCQARAATRHNLLVMTEARQGVVSHNSFCHKQTLYILDYVKFVSL